MKGITTTGIGTDGPILSETSFVGAGMAPDIMTATCMYKEAAITLATVALPPISQEPAAIVTYVLTGYSAAPGDAGKTVRKSATVSGFPALFDPTASTY